MCRMQPHNHLSPLFPQLRLRSFRTQPQLKLSGLPHCLLFHVGFAPTPTHPPRFLVPKNFVFMFAVVALYLCLAFCR